MLLLIMVISHPGASGQTASAMRRPISPQQPMWLVHIDTWNYPDPQKIIALIPQDIRPYVVMNISISISHNTTTGQFQVAEYGYEVAKSWMRACAENGMWTMIQQSSGGLHQFPESDLTIYEEFFRDYPNFLGFNYAEHFWGFDDPNDPASAPWTARMTHLANLLNLTAKYGGYLVMSWCGNQYSPNINPIGMLKRSSAFAQACRDHTENFILCEKYTTVAYQFDKESTCLGAYLSGYSGQYGVRYDNSGWTDYQGNNTNLTEDQKFTLASGGAPHLEHMMLTGETVIDGPEIIWMNCFKELSSTSIDNGYTARRWGTFACFDNVMVDMFRKVLDGTVRIPSRQEVIDRTKVVVVNNVNSGGNDAIYSSPDTLFEGLYRMEGDGGYLDGNYQNNKSFFKKTGRYPTIPTVYLLDDAAANSFQVKINKSTYATRWPTIAAKQAELNSLFPSEYTGDLYAGRLENGWVTYNPYKTNQSASGSIPFKYNTCDHMDLTYSRYTSGVIKEYANKVTFYLTNYQNEIDTSLKTDTIKIYGATSEPTWSYTDRASHQASVVTKSWTGGILTLTVQHNGALDLTVNCSGAGTGRLTAYTPAVLTPPAAPLAYPGIRQYEAECFDYKNITGITTSAYAGSIRNYTGQGYLQFGNGSTAAVRDAVTAPKAGTYRLETRYAVTTGNIGSVDLYVNGTKVATPLFNQTATLSDWAVHKQAITLNAGSNTIEFRANATGGGSLYFDSIAIVPTAYDGGVVIQENKTGFVGVDGTVDSDNAGFTGDGFANTIDAAGAGIDWSVCLDGSPVKAFRFRYASLSDTTADLSVNGSNVASSIQFPATGSLSSWDYVTVHVAAGEGISNVRLQATTSTGLPNIDYVEVIGGGTTPIQSIEPSADAYVRAGGDAGSNFGTSAELVVKNAGSAGSNLNRNTFLKFDVRALANAQSVKLKLTPTKVDGPATLAYELVKDDSWTESGVTWNNQPSVSGTVIANVNGYAVGQPIVIDVTSLVRNEALVDGTLSIRISDPNAAANYIGFGSRETAGAGLRPVLEYTLVPGVPELGKLVQLRFDETTGTTAFDSTGHGWNGTLLNGSNWISGTDAKLNGAVALNGTNGGFVSLPAGVVNGVNDFTVAFWVKLNTISTWSRVFDFSTGSTQNSMYFTPLTSGGRVRFGLRVNGNAQNLETPAGFQFPTGAWTHVAVTLSENTATMYIDGVAVATNAAMTNRPAGLGSTTVNSLGKSVSSDPYLDGSIDEFQVHNIALSPALVAALAAPIAAPTNLFASPSDSKVVLTWDAVEGAISYTIKRATTSGGPFAALGSTGTASFVDTSAVNGTSYYYVVTANNSVTESANSIERLAIPAPMRAYLRFDDGSGITALDASGNGWQGTVVNTPIWVAGNEAKIGGALKLAASSNQHVTLPSGVVNGLTDFTVACWVNLNSISTWSRIFDFSTGSTQNSMYLTPRTSGGVVRFGLRVNGNAQNIEGPAPLASGRWTHVAVSRSGTTATLYVDGVAVASTNSMSFTPSSLGITTVNYIGRSVSADPYLDGAVDEFRIYGSALSAREIGALANLSSSQLGAAAPTFAQWLSASFPGQSDSSIVGPIADPDHDGQVNLLEYYFGGNPGVKSAPEVMNGMVDGSGNIVLTYRRSKNLSGVTASVQASADCVTWIDTGVSPEIVSDGGSYHVLRATVPMGAAKRKFLRLVVHNP
ncbi:glycoside hydrolase family 98 domain-containing protein [Luteolibacter sp. LG18]|uniref:glycoside hydrolase family 98 domain-containing protein n=1 Tax=Luteolibacter sp. LG18 TaxID=2819286 RepID=UPI0030C73FA8